MVVSAREYNRLWVVVRLWLATTSERVRDLVGVRVADGPRCSGVCDGVLNRGVDVRVTVAPTTVGVADASTAADSVRVVRAGVDVAWAPGVRVRGVSVIVRKASVLSL